MVTTIQITDATIQSLRVLKERTSSTSYDEVINKLLKNQTKESLAGIFSKSKKYSREQILNNLRDKFD